jgi:hypothetical protein
LTSVPPGGPNMSRENGGVKPPQSKAGSARKCPNSIPLFPSDGERGRG